jgi:hypothetical protein
VFYLEDGAGNVGTVIVGAYGVDISAPQAVDESWYSAIAAKPDADPYTSGNGKDEVLSTPTNNSIRLLFTFNELIGNAVVTAYINGTEAPSTADYIRYTVSGTMLTIEFKQNCQAKIVVSDIRGNKATLWRPEDGEITVIDKDAPIITNAEKQIADNKVTVTYTFNELVTQTGKDASYANTHTVIFDKNGVFPITFADKANNVVTAIASISEIDDQSPKIHYALQITPQGAGLKEDNGEIIATNGNIEIAIGAEDVNGAAITVINRNKPNIPLSLGVPTIITDSKFTKAVTVSENGIYIITAVDGYGNTNTVNVRINFIDKEAPVILMESSRALEVVVNSTTETQLREQLLTGVTASDNMDGDVPVNADISGVSLSAAGNYTTTYTATDSLGNVGTKTRTVSVLTKERKALLINGKSARANDIYITRDSTAEFDLSALVGYKLYAVAGYKTRAQMKYVPSLTGLSYALPSKGYYTVLAQNGEMDAFLVYIYVH